MNRTYVFVFLLGLIAISLTAEVNAATTTRIFYSDLQSGPNTGGQDNQGAFVTLYGVGFGASRGSSTVSIGGVPAANYPYWSDTKIVFQLGAGALTGNIVAQVNGTSSNGVQFTVRAGNIYFVGPSGSDGNNGSFNAPWATVSHAVSGVMPGDIVYLMDGTAQATPDSNGAAVSLATSGTSASPIAVVAYPGATATIGSSSTQYSIYSAAALRYWLFAGLQLRA